MHSFEFDTNSFLQGFRVELDGIGSTLASFPGVTRATALLIDGQVHGFVSPAHHDVSAVLEHTKKSQPYYAVPTKVHVLAHLPSTANGKIDKKALKVIATTEVIEVIEVSEKTTDPELALETLSNRSMPSNTTSARTSSEEKKDLHSTLPEKSHGQPIRGLRHKIFIIYRQLFSIIWLINIAALIALILTHGGNTWFTILPAANFVACVLIRQDTVINILYTVFCSVPKSAPLWIRTRCAEIYHLGGVHSGAGIFTTIWIWISTIRSTIEHVTDGSMTHLNPNALAVLVLSWMLCALTLCLVAFAYPGFRKKYHNTFEQIHRFIGWTTLIIFWIRTVLSIDGERTQELGMALVQNPVFWILIIATLSIASSWFYLRKVPVEAEVLSNHAVRLHFDYTTPVNGSFTRLSRRPLLEWHSFAVIPKPKPSGKGYSLIVSNAGDWTKNSIQNPPTHIWVRSLPTCGVMRITTLFNRVVIICTGSGIGPVLGHVTHPSCPTQLIWSTPNPEATFGKGIIDSIKGACPEAVIHDTRSQGRPDLVKMGFNMAKNFGAEAVVIIANEKITKKVVYGLQTRGVPAYGAIWDS